MRPWVLMWLLMSCLFSLTARAQTEASTVENARLLFNEGIAAARAGKLSAAEALFIRSRALSETANTLLNLAIVQNELKHYLDALDTLDALDARSDRDADPARKEKSAKLRALALAEVAVLEVSVEPEDSEVRVNGMARRGPVRLTPGVHELEISRQGHIAQESSLTLTRGEVRRLRIDLQPKPGAVVPPPNLVTDAPEDVAREAPANAPSTSKDAPTPTSTPRRRLRVALIVAGAVLAAAAGTVTVILLTRSEKTEADAF